jgi:hypothetical protein
VRATLRGAGAYHRVMTAGWSWTVTALALLAAGCASPRRAERPPESPLALALPEPDPACRATVREALGRNGLERVVLKLGFGPERRIEVLDVLSPDLTPAGKLELKRAMAGCTWAPVATEGGADTWTTVMARDRLAP